MPQKFDYSLNFLSFLLGVLTILTIFASFQATAMYDFFGTQKDYNNFFCNANNKILLACLITVVGIPAIGYKIYKNDEDEDNAIGDIVRWLFDEFKFNYLLYYLNVGILILIITLMGLHLVSGKFLLVLLFLIPLIMIIIITVFSYYYSQYDIPVFLPPEVFKELYPEAENYTGFKKFLQKNSGEVMCTVFIVLYVLILISVFIMKTIYNHIPEHIKLKIEKVSTSEIKLDQRINNFKLTFLYYYLGIVITIYSLIIASFFGDQNSESYQYYFCNTNYNKNRTSPGNYYDPDDNSDPGGSSIGGGGY